MNPEFVRQSIERGRGLEFIRCIASEMPTDELRDLLARCKMLFWEFERVAYIWACDQLSPEGMKIEVTING